MAQIHGLDSIKEVHALDGTASWRRVHPISVYLFGKYTKFIPHLLTKHPSNAVFAFQEESYKNLGIIPTLVLYNSDQKIRVPQIKDMLKRAKSLSETGSQSLINLWRNE